MAVLVAALPTSPPNLLLNPWAHADGDNTTPSHVHWTDESAGGNLISVSRKVTEPTPYSELDGAGLATAFRLADVIGEDGGGQADAGGITGTLTQVRPADPAKRRLFFFMHYVSAQIETFQVIISGSDDEAGPWTELWRPYSETFKETSMAWTAMETSPVHEKVIATGYDFLQVKFEVRFANAASQGMKWTGVYLAQSAAEDPAGYEAITVGTSTNSKGSARTVVPPIAHNNNGEAILVAIQMLSTTTSAPTVTSPAYDGVALTEITEAARLSSYLSNRHLHVRWYYLADAAAGINDFTVTLANAAHDAITIISLSGVDPITFFRRIATYDTGNNANSNTRAKIRVNTTRPKSVVFSACHIITANSGPFAPDGSMTELFDTFQGSGTNGICFVVQHKTIATSDTLDAGTASTTDRQFSLSGVEILAEGVAVPVEETVTLSHNSGLTVAETVDGSGGAVEESASLSRTLATTSTTMLEATPAMALARNQNVAFADQGVVGGNLSTEISLVLTGSDGTGPVEETVNLARVTALVSADTLAGLATLVLDRTAAVTATTEIITQAVSNLNHNLAVAADGQVGEGGFDETVSLNRSSTLTAASLAEVLENSSLAMSLTSVAVEEMAGDISETISLSRVAGIQAVSALSAENTVSASHSLAIVVFDERQSLIVDESITISRSASTAGLAYAAMAEALELDRSTTTVLASELTGAVALLLAAACGLGSASALVGGNTTSLGGSYGLVAVGTGLDADNQPPFSVALRHGGNTTAKVKVSTTRASVP